MAGANDNGSCHRIHVSTICDFCNTTQHFNDSHRMTESIESHNGRIRKTSTAITQASGETFGARTAADSAITHVWETLLDLCTKNPDLEDLKEAATVVQRLTAAYNHIATQDAKQQTGTPKQPSLQLPPKLLAQIETALKLL